MDKIAADILNVGGGPAGLAAAAAASECGAAVTLVDDNPSLGGQIWRAELGKVLSKDSGRLIEAANRGGVHLVSGAQIFTAASGNSLSAETSRGRLDLEYRTLIIATGAREIFLPFPGWTLPNVLGAGGLQALVKGGLAIGNKRVVVAGTGPFLLAVAEYLRSKGASVAAIVEQAPASKINRFARGLRREPAKLIQAAILRAKLIGVPYLRDAWVAAATGDGQLRSVIVRTPRKELTIECDYLACGFHFAPNTELAELLGCELRNGFVDVDELQRTSKENIFCVGEPTGIGGVEASLVEGRIAGYAAAGEAGRAKALFSKRDRTRRFGDSLNKTFALRDELKTLNEASTIVCRCEDVQYGKLKEFESWRTAKLQTRCGMGPCQGRICGPAAEFLFGWKRDSVRPPIFPVKLENL